MLPPDFHEHILHYENQVFKRRKNLHAIETLVDLYKVK